ncbi:MAG: hypothetical protein R6U85_09415, partial [Salinivirgaceae bacterium]
MDKCRRNIVVLEPSRIIYEGLYTSISKSEYDYSFFYADSLVELETLMLKRDISIVLINPSVVQNRLKEFVNCKTKHTETRWIGIIYAYYDSSILKEFDTLFPITEDISRQAYEYEKKIQDKSVTKVGVNKYTEGADME